MKTNEKAERLAVNGALSETETQNPEQTVKPQPDSQFAPAPLLGIAWRDSEYLYAQNVGDTSSKVRIPLNVIQSVVNSSYKLDEYGEYDLSVSNLCPKS